MTKFQNATTKFLERRKSELFESSAIKASVKVCASNNDNRYQNNFDQNIKVHKDGISINYADQEKAFFAFKNIIDEDKTQI